jgi:hypothetical protein
MQPSHFLRAGLMALLIALITMLSWEIHLRHKGFRIIYDDNEALWASKRAMVYEPRDRASVFIGASRIKYDLDIPTWEAITGTRAIQLANVGSTPRGILKDLADDPEFKGNLIIDITEGIFFSEVAFYDWKTNKKIAYFKNETPTQRFSFEVDHLLESKFVFLDQDNFSINAMMDNLRPPPRPGVFPGLYFPFGFTPVSFDRQSYMTPGFVADTNQHNAVKAIWSYGLNNKREELPKDRMDAIFNSVNRDVNKIKSRGGQVIFIRPPSTGLFWEVESKGFPRTAYWERLLTLTGCEGIHFKDYPATANLNCPEWSHLTPADAATYTKELVAALREKGWSFNKKGS